MTSVSTIGISRSQRRHRRDTPGDTEVEDEGVVHSKEGVIRLNSRPRGKILVACSISVGSSLLDITTTLFCMTPLRGFLRVLGSISRYMLLLFLLCFFLVLSPLSQYFPYGQ